MTPVIRRGPWVGADTGSVWAFGPARIARLADEQDAVDRRGFLKAAGIGAAALAARGRMVTSAEKPKPAQTAIPRWRGFNLLDYFSPRPMRPNSRNRTTEDDFRWMSDWGFDFV